MNITKKANKKKTRQLKKVKDKNIIKIKIKAKSFRLSKSHPKMQSKLIWTTVKINIWKNITPVFIQTLKNKISRTTSNKKVNILMNIKVISLRQNYKF